VNISASPSDSAVSPSCRARIGRKYKVLFIGPGPAPPSTDRQKNLHFHISEFCEGDLISTHWGSPREFRGQSLASLYDTLGSFRYHAVLSGAVPRLARRPWEVAYLVWKGLRLSRARGSFDAIVTYGPFSFALVGCLISRFTGAKLVIEIPGPPFGGFEYHDGFFDKLKHRVARLYVPRLLRSAHALRLYFPSQLNGLPPGNYPPAFVFPDLVAVSSIESLAAQATAGTEEPYALFMGFPFARKGVDVLIHAFKLISKRYPDLSLKIVGHCPDLAPFQKLAEGNPRINFLPGQPHEKAMELMANCTFFVLPSRAEGVPRVLIEAMAASKPIISTRIHGTPYLVGSALQWLLVEPDDVAGLAARMEALLDDPELARSSAEEGHRRIFENFSEQCYRENFANMMEFLVPAPSPKAS
jgi:glycosyltransferase involved in cell wall biosynthesis